MAGFDEKHQHHLFLGAAEGLGKGQSCGVAYNAADPFYLKIKTLLKVEEFNFSSHVSEKALIFLVPNNM
jgi:hypothetical protein